MNLEEQFQALERLLSLYRGLWQVQAFHCTGNPWPQYPELWHRLQQRTADELSRPVSRGQAGTASLRLWVAEADMLADLCQVDHIAAQPPPLPTALDYAVPGRKWQQVLPFATLVPPRREVIEWCAGHGHTGRVLAAAGARSVASLERDEALCKRGRELARRAGVTVAFHQVDVLAASAAAMLRSGSHAVALHACGDLHTTLLRQGVRRALRGLTVAPCCYHLTREAVYRPLSLRGQASALRLSRADLRLAVKQTATAGAADRRRARTEVSWRLGFDSLQRALRNSNEYLPLPAIPRALLKGDFPTFIRWAAERKALPLPNQVDLEYFENRGAERYCDVRRVEWVQNLFQRPLELWLLLDRALFLQDHGYRVRVGTFCAEQATPRNLVICAEAH